MYLVQPIPAIAVRFLMGCSGTAAPLLSRFQFGATARTALARDALPSDGTPPSNESLAAVTIAGRV